MAYAAAAVSSVMQTLEYLLHFSRMVVRIQKFHIETFAENGHELARLFEECSSLTDQSGRAALDSAIYLTYREVICTIAMEDFFNISVPTTRVAILKAIVEELALDITCSTPRMTEMISDKSEEGEDILAEVPKTLQELALVEVELQKLFVKNPEMFKDHYPYPVGDPEEIFLAIAKLKKSTFVHKEAMKLKGLFRDLSFFMAFLRDTANLYKNQDVVKDLERCISVMARRAEDFIEEKLLDISLRSKLDSLILKVMESRAEDSDEMHASLGAKFKSLMLMERKRAEDSTEENMPSKLDNFAEEKLDASPEAGPVEKNLGTGAEFFFEETLLSALPATASNYSTCMESTEELFSEKRFCSRDVNFFEVDDESSGRASDDFLPFGAVSESMTQNANFWVLFPELPNLPMPDVFAEEFSQPLLDSPFKFDLDPLLSITKTALIDIFNDENGILAALSSKFQEIETLKEKVKTMYEVTLDIQNLRLSSISTKVSKPLLVKEDMVVGYDDISDEILHRRSSGLEILTVVGMGGIGKTTLARKIYDHPFSVSHFHCRAWIAVSQVYQVRNLLLGLLHSITQLSDEINKSSTEELAEYLYKRLKGRRYLIVIDDIWSIKAWDDVSRIFPDDTNGSRILLTTRLKNVALKVNPRIPPYCMSVLGVDESWKLLEQKVFGKGNCPSELVDCCEHIANKCQGLPLAIVVIAGYLSRIKRTYECWKDAAATLTSLVITDPENCLEILALSYNRLPHHLKACFLYMGAFPEHRDIDVKKLINLWIAEGLLDLNTSKSLEEVGEDCLNDLVDRGLVLIGKMSSSEKIKTCRIHDLLRELCLQEAEKEKFMQVIKRDSRGFMAHLNDKHLLSFHSEFHGDVYLLPSLPLVRSFLCFSSGCFFSPDIFFLHLRFKLLRVLDISFLHFDNFPAQILDLLLLSYLELTVSSEIPEKLSLLKNLCTLVIHGSWNTKQRGESLILLLEYWNMPCLRHLHISVTSSLRYPSLSKRHLPYHLAPNSLQTLSTIRFGSCRREAFEVMPHLKKLGICETRDDVLYSSYSSQLLRNLVYLEQLEILKCSFYMNNSRMKGQKLVSYMAFPLSIRQLTLRRSFLPWEDLTSISRLPNLEVLKLKDYAFQGREWEPTEDGFSRLKHLLIDKTDLENWRAYSIHFPALKRLVLRSCNLLREIPFDLGEIPTLEVIELHYCSKSAEVSAEEIRSQTEGVEVHIRSSLPMENHLKRTLSSDSFSSLHSKKPMTS